MKKLEYETKCRRCNGVSEWNETEYTASEYLKFAERMQNLTKFPSQMHCEYCNKMTIQAIVSFTPITDI